jgi:hypothetical protein
MSFRIGVFLTRDRHGNRRYGPGEYCDDDLYWRDGKTGIRYHVHAIEAEECEIQGTDRGTDWLRGTLSRLVRAPAITACRFEAVTDNTAQIAGSISFSRHARHGVHHLDDLDPATAGLKTTDRNQDLVWAGDHQRAATALARLDSVLAARGWKPRRESGTHWYSLRYRRAVILWEQPVHRAEIRSQTDGGKPAPPPGPVSGPDSRRPGAGNRLTFGESLSGRVIADQAAQERAAQLGADQAVTAPGLPAGRRSR